MTAPSPAIELRAASLAYGERVVWAGVDLSVAAGEVLAVLGPNGAGKTSLVRVLLGLEPLRSGTCTVDGAAPRRGSPRLGYVPQQKRLDLGGMVRCRDFVGFGLDGHRFGLGARGGGDRRARRARIDRVLDDVGASGFSDVPVDALSGGEQQRVRIAQALVGDPAVLVCDEPLLSLDLARQRAVVELLDRRRREHGTAVVFVTHEINPVLPVVDRVLYLAGGRARSGSPDEVMTTEVLSDLYRTPVDVLRVRDRIVVVGASDDHHHEHGSHDDHADHEGEC